jgi:hypothetical protein
MNAKEIPCPACSKPMGIIEPVAEVVNAITVSAVIWTHQEPQVCPSCGCAFQWKLAGMENPKLKWAIVQVQSSKSVIEVVPSMPSVLTKP